MLRLTVHGAAGRMGRRVVALAAEDTAFQLIGAVEHSSNPLLGEDAGVVAQYGKLEVPLTDQWPSSSDVVIDFSLPDAVGDVIKQCVRVRTPLVVATTGLNDSQQAELTAAAHQIPIVWAPSMSTAVNLSMQLAAHAAKTLTKVTGGTDIEIVERHHRFKEDAPSGTALKFGQLIAQQLDSEITHVFSREGKTGARTQHEIGYHAIRTGDDPGQHTIVFGMLGETVEIRVAASNRDCYASGALTAAKWIVGKGAGLHDMFDVLGLENPGREEKR